MSTRVMVIGAAVLLGGVVLALAIMADNPPGPVKRGQPGVALDDPDGLMGMRRAAAGVDPTRPTTPGQVDRLIYNTRNRKGQLIQFMVDTLDPQPNGVSDVTQPVAQVHLKDFQRIIQIEAERGTLIAPDNQPRSGDLFGRVVLTLFDAPPGKRADTRPDSPHAKLRVTLDSAKFDLELNTVQSDGPVDVTADRLRFSGVGLRLAYNDKRRRLERLEVFEGRRMRFRANAAESAKSSKPEATDKPDAQPKATDEAAQAQLYHATLSKDVRIESTQADMAGDRLDVVFGFLREPGDDPVLDSLEGDGGSSAQATDNAAANLASTSGGGAGGPLTFKPADDDIVLTWSGPMLVVPQEERPADLAGPEDVLLTMAGAPLRIDTPEQESVRAAKLAYAGEAERIELTGDDEQPLVIQAPKLGEFHGVQLRLSQKTGRGQIMGPGHLTTRGKPDADTAATRDAKSEASSDKLPPDMTVAWRDGVDLTFYQRNKTAAKESADNARAADRDDNNAAGTAPADNERELGSLAALKAADFHGGVNVQHARLDMTGDTLALALTDPSAGRQELERLNVTGHVHAKARGSKPEEQISIKSDNLDVNTTRDEATGRVRPTLLLAAGHVEAQQPDRALRAGALEVHLAPAPPAEDATADDAKKQDQDDLIVTRMVARTDVRVNLTEHNTQAFANELVADVAKDTAELFGSKEKPARVERPDATFESRHILLNQKDQTVTAPMPGRLTFRTGDDGGADKVAPVVGATAGKGAVAPLGAPTGLFGEEAKVAAAAQGDEKAEDQPGDTAGEPASPAAVKTAKADRGRGHTTVDITWQTAMSFDNQKNFARFIGDVVCHALTQRDRTRATADELRVQFADTPTTAPGSEEGADKVDDKTDAKKPATDDPFTGRKQITSADLRGKAKFAAESFADKLDGKLATRFTLTGPHIAFAANDEREGVQVVGEGSMLIEDYREEKKKDEEGAEKSAKPQAATGGTADLGVAFAGRGATLFVWQTGLTLDAKKNDVTIEDGVQMVHEPTGSEGVMQLDCRKLVADFEETGGIGVWLSGENPQPTFKALYADGEGGAVRVVHGKRTVTTDHLTYTAADQTVLLTAAKGRTSEVAEEGQPTALRAEAFEWDLKRDRLTLIKAGVARAPLKQETKKE